MIPPHTKAIPLWNARASAARAFFFFLRSCLWFAASRRFSSFPPARQRQYFHRSCLWPAAKRWFSSSPSGSPKAISVGLVSAERSFFGRFRLWPVRVPFSPLLYFLPGAGAFLFPPPADFPSPFRQNSAAQHGPAVVPHLNLYKHKNTRFGPAKAPNRVFLFPKSCGGKNTKTLSALIRSRRCPGRSPRR